MLDFNNNIASIGGWLTKDEAHILYELSKDVPSSQSIVEIGAWVGRSTICLGKGAKDGYRAKVFSVDPHIDSFEVRKIYKDSAYDTFPEFSLNLKNAGIEDVVIPLKLKSLEVVQKFKNDEIGFLFIDGSHYFRDVKDDYNSWFPKVAEGGIIAFHDSWHKLGPRIVSATILLNSNQIRNPRLVDTITYFEKSSQISFTDRIRNGIFLISRSIFGFKGWLKLHFTGIEV